MEPRERVSNGFPVQNPTGNEDLGGLRDMCFTTGKWPPRFPFKELSGINRSILAE